MAGRVPLGYATRHVLDALNRAHGRAAIFVNNQGHLLLCVKETPIWMSAGPFMHGRKRAGQAKRTILACFARAVFNGRAPDPGIRGLWHSVSRLVHA